jgi:hypothetical protein
MKRILSTFLIAGLVVSPSSAAAPKVTKKVEVNGKRYRVTTMGDAVLVANKAMIVSYDIHERDDQRAAVKVATGCSIVDELPSDDARLRGKLKCSD